jgi:integrase
MEKPENILHDIYKILCPSLSINIHFHVSRHSWATLALSKGVDIYTVSKIMGHSSVAITEIYANLINKKRDEVADIMNLEITKADRDRKKKINKAKEENSSNVKPKK